MNFWRSFFKQYLWIVPFCLFFTGYYLPTLFFRTNLITNPQVVGLPLPQALDTLSKAHLAARIIAYRNDSECEEGTVLMQNPSAQSAIRPQQTVFLTLAAKQPKATTPTCVGLSLIALEKELKEKELPFKLFSVISNYPEEQCIGQTPEAGAPITHEGIILYKASSCLNDWLLVPSFYQKSFHEVVTLLEKEGITYSVIHSYPIEEEHTCSDCFVVNQKPVGGSFIQKSCPPTFQLQLNS